jgi:hypothetical protein
MDDRIGSETLHLRGFYLGEALECRPKTKWGGAPRPRPIFVSIGFLLKMSHSALISGERIQHKPGLLKGGEKWI